MFASSLWNSPNLRAAKAPIHVKTWAKPPLNAWNSRGIEIFTLDFALSFLKSFATKNTANRTWTRLWEVYILDLLQKLARRLRLVKVLSPLVGPVRKGSTRPIHNLRDWARQPVSFILFFEARCSLMTSSRDSSLFVLSCRDIFPVT